MSVLEQILQDIQTYETEMEEAGISCLCPAWVEAIIKKHLSAEDMSGSANKGWIPIEKGLPKEPPKEVDDEEELEECIVMIKGAKKATTLRYAGDGTWWEDGIYYEVIAWRPMPEPYKPEKEDKQEVIGTEFFHKRFMEVK